MGDKIMFIKLTDETVLGDVVSIENIFFGGTSFLEVTFSDGHKKSMTINVVKKIY
jgi:hypothetical protein